MTPHLIISAIFAFTLAAKGSGPISTEAIDRHYQSIQKNDYELLQSESMILEAQKQSGPSEPLTWRLARTYYMLGKQSKEDAAKSFFHRCIGQADQAIKLNSQSAWGYFLRGLCRGKLGEIEGVWKSLAIIKPLKQDFLTAIQYDPSVNEGGPHRALGKLYLELPALLGGSIDKSVDHLKQAVALGPDFADNHLFLAEAFYEKGNYRSAKETLMDLLEITNRSNDLPRVQKVRRRANELMDKINPWLDPKNPNASRD